MGIQPATAENIRARLSANDLKEEFYMNVKKVAAGVTAAAVLCSLSVCGTLAYLKDSTSEVRNTFTVGSIFDPDDPDAGLLLQENDPVKQDDGTYTLDQQTFVTSATYDSVLPADELPKNPALSATALIADAYAFVEVVDETSDLTFAIDEGWTLVSDSGPNGGAVYTAGLVSGSEEGTDWAKDVLLDDKVTVAEDAEGDLGSLSFYGYICQAAGFDSAEAAWQACFGA